MTPSGFKFTESPKPFKVTLQTSGEDDNPAWISVSGEEVELEGDERDLERLQRILDQVKASPGQPKSTYVQGYDKSDGLRSLRQLEVQGRIRIVKKGKSELCVPVAAFSTVNRVEEVNLYGSDHGS